MEEIKASDLMIGNWFIGYDGKPFQWQVEHFALLTLGKNSPTIDELIKEPIPITEDILLKTGFEKDEEGLFSMGSFIVAKTKLRWAFFNNGLSGEELTRIEYLHELQNIFRILTIDIEV